MADDELSVSWEAEAIPDADEVYMRAHRTHFTPKGELRPGVFRDQGAGMSADWSKYATPEETRARAKTPEANAVLALGVGALREVETLSVVHEPLAEEANRSHSEVFGTKTEEVRLKLLRLHRRAIDLA